MKKALSLNDPRIESRSYLQRASVILLLSAIGIAILLVRMIYLQLVDHSFYEQLSDKNRIDMTPIPPTRGLIYDRAGTLLAENRPIFNLEVIPEQAHNLNATITILKEWVDISESDLKRFEKEKKRKRRFEAVTLKQQLTDKEVAMLSVNRHFLPGVEIEARLIRHYPLGESHAHVLGYVGLINEIELKKTDASNYRGTETIGKIGIERAFEANLHGKTGHRQSEVDSKGRAIRNLKQSLPTPGQTLTLTIDSQLQKVAFEALSGHRGAIVALDPSDGAILAMASAPSYDNNLFAKGIDSKTYSRLINDKSRPMFNRAVAGRYPPGSTVKPFLGLLGLDSGAVTNEDTFPDPGYYKLESGTRLFRDWKRSGHGQAVNLEKALVESCDTYFYHLAFMQGIDNIHPFLAQFGFGELSGSGLLEERKGLLPSRVWKKAKLQRPWYPGETLITGIGQGFMLVTPVQLAASTALIANRGQPITPHLVQPYMQPTPLKSSFAEAIELNNINYWQDIHDAMVKSVHTPKGTAWSIGEDADYMIAGKTGTSQVVSIPQGERYDADKLDKSVHDHALFIAYAPADDPKIVLSVVIENGNSGAALEPAKKVMDYFLTQPQSILTR